MAMRSSIILALVFSFGCGESNPGDPLDGGNVVADATPGGDPDSRIPGAPDAMLPDLENCPAPLNLTRGARWVRENPMFISGLTVAMGAPTVGEVNSYFDDFKANAVQLWEDGLPTEMDGWAAAGRNDFRWVSWTKKDGTSHDGNLLVGGYGANPPGRIGYQVGDEPRTTADYNAIKAGIATIRAHDPDALIYVNFSIFADAIDDFLADYAQNQVGDVVSYDTYSLSNSLFEHLQMFRETGLAGGIPYWGYVKGFSDGNGFSTESDMRFQVFAHVLYGFTGYSWFVYQVGPPHDGLLPPAFYTQSANLSGTRTPRYDAAAQVNVELAHLGRVLAVLTSTDVRYLPWIDLALPDGVSKWQPGSGNDPYLTAIDRDNDTDEISLGFFSDDCDEGYIIVQNSNHDNASFPNENTNSISITLSFDFSGAPQGLDTGSVLAFNKTNGTIGERPLIDGPGGKELKLDIPAGEIVFFKYKTGRTFAGQDLGQ